MKISIKHSDHKKTVVLSFFALVFVTSIVIIFIVKNYNTAFAAGFDAGNIITDSKMSDINTMNESQIRQFIYNKNSNCAASNSLCFRNYNENGKDAAAIIYEVSREHRINPEVILSTIQKEQALVTHANPQQWMYNSAMGYNCPDSTPGKCGPDAKGFLRQVVWGATMFRAILDGGGNWSNRYASGTRWYTPYILGANNIQWNPDRGCGTSVVNIQNRATQALYNYTPYRPNDAALNAGYGLGNNCSSYGNRNFYLFMRDWFGYIASENAYVWESAGQTLYFDAARTQSLPYNAILNPGQTVYGEIKARNSGAVTWTKTNTLLATERSRDRQSAFYDSSWISSNRVTRLVESEVAPGNIGTFQFVLKAPSNSSTFNEYFNIVLEGQSWLRDIGLYFPVNVQLTREIQLYRDQSRTNEISNNNVNINEPIYGRLRIVNNTGSTLPANDTIIATTSPADRVSDLYNTDWLSQNRVAKLGNALAAGQSGIIDFRLKTPTSLGTVNEQFGLVIEGLRWIEQDTIKINYNVKEKPADSIGSSSKEILLEESIVANDSRYSFTLQSDGNLVLYSPSRAVWASNTVGSGGNRLVMQSDGNLVLYSPSRAVWASNTVGSGGNRLVMQSDGNLVLYSPSRAVWASNTANK